MCGKSCLFFFVQVIVAREGLRILKQSGHTEDSVQSKITILITGATDGIGLQAARLLVHQGHTVLIHGRNRTKLESTARELGSVDSFEADLLLLSNVRVFAEEVSIKR
jgi:NADP-dependent 3-hydroxy acid dehydrogenase YdfG